MHVKNNPWKIAKGLLRSLALFSLFTGFALTTQTTKAQTLGEYQFQGSNGCTSNNVTTQPSHATFSAFTSTNTTCFATANAYVQYNWNTSNTIQTNQYNQFTITPSSGYQQTLTNLTFTQFVNFGTSSSWILRSSIDGYASNIATGTATTTYQTPSVTLPSSSFTNVGAVTFRFYLIDANSNVTGWVMYNVILSGSVAVTCTNPSAPGNPTSNTPQCASSGVTLTESGSAPSGVTWYWQGSNSSGTSTANNATSTYNASSSGTYYIRAQNNTGLCWSTSSGSVTVTVNPLPTITLGSAPTVCAGTTSANLTYSATSNSPNQYSITYSSSAISAGFSNVSNATLPSSPITLTVPIAAATGTYNYTVTVTNSTTGCISSNTTNSITINAPATVTPGGPDLTTESSSPAAINLTGASVGGEATTGAWSIVSGGGSLSSTSQTSTPQSVTYTPAANYSGTAVLTLTTNSVVCSSANGNRTITIDPATSQTFLSSGTFTVSANVTNITVQTWGAGGGGGGNSTNANGGGGGGGGAYSSSSFTVTPGATYSVTVGAGGAGGVLSANGTNGGDSWFNNNTTLLAKGGVGGLQESGSAGGTGGSGGSTSSGIGTTKFSGGNGAAGNTNSIGTGGGGGSSAGTAANGGNAPTAGVGSSSGGTAPSGGGNGGGDTYYTPGANGVSPGGGAGGASIIFVGAGGTGSGGQVIVTWATAMAISSNTVSAASSCPSTTNVPIHSFLATGTNSGITDLTFTTTGTYATSEISNFKIYYTTTNTFSTTNLLATISSPLAAGTQTFPAFSQTLVNGTNYYFWITMDVSSTVTNGHTIAVSSTSPSNITSVVTPTGSANASGTQTLQANATIGLSSATGTNHQTQCIGPAITAITYTVSGGGTGATVAGLPTGVTGSYSSGTFTISGTPTQTGTFNYTVTTSGSCTQATTTGTITVNALPTVTVNSATICNGQSTTLTASGSTSYLWSTGATTITINVSPTTTSSYTITGTSAAGCSSVATNTVIVDVLPMLTVNSITICTGQSTTLTASGATSYLWSTGATTSTINVSPTTTTNYTITGTSAAGCSSIATNTITVNALPMVSVNSATICNGQSSTLTASGAASYLWSTGATTTTINVSPTTTTSYTITGTSAAGCSSVATNTVTVNALPTVSVNSVTICNGSSATLTASGATNYLWSSGATTTTITASPMTTTNYTVTGTSAAGCSSSITATVTVNIPGVWTGLTNTDWFNTNNWGGCGAPTNVIDAIILSGAANMPNISNTGAVCRSMTINSGATLTTSNSNNLNVYGNWTNNGTYTAENGTISFTGSGNQTISGSTTTVFNTLKVNKTRLLILTAPINVSGSLSLTKGIIETTSNGTLQLLDNTTSSAGSDSSYIYGSMGKIGSNAFTFPLGDTILTSSAYHPLTITAPTNATDAFTAQYFASNQTYGNTIQNDSLETISNCEYWVLNRTSGTSVVTPSLGWNSNSCNIGENQDIRVAGWNGTQWTSMGNVSFTVNGNQGILTAKNGINGNLLPLTIARFGSLSINTTGVDIGDTVNYVFKYNIYGATGINGAHNMGTIAKFNHAQIAAGGNTITMALFVSNLPDTVSIDTAKVLFNVDQYRMISNVRSIQLGVVTPLSPKEYSIAGGGRTLLLLDTLSNDTSNNFAPFIYVALDSTGAITPNNDGKYDVLKVVSDTAITGYNLQIFNIDSVLLFQSSSISSVWNAKDSNGVLVPNGTYIYKLSFNGQLAIGQFSVRYSPLITVVLNNNIILSPNNDGQYDSLVVIANQPVSSYNLQIFNQDSVQIYQNSTISQFWNGTDSTGALVPVGNYFYQITCNGQFFSNQFIVNYPPLISVVLDSIGAITPNSSQYNSMQVLSNGQVQSYSLQIVDLNNNPVFETSTISNYWNGKNANNQLVPVGTYYFLIVCNQQTFQGQVLVSY